MIDQGRFSTWQLIKFFWQSVHRVYAYALLIILIIMTISAVLLEVIFSYWHNHFYNALQSYDKTSVINLIYIFLFLAAINLTLLVARYYLSQTFVLRWRKWLTTRIIKRWLKNDAYYSLEYFETHTDNPDQRIQEDIASLVSNSMSLFIGLIAAITSFLAFIYVLWELSATLTIPLGPFGKLVIPGYLVWITILYALTGTFFTLKIGRPLVNLNFEQQRREATFRYAAVDLRNHAEHIALYRGENQQKKVLIGFFHRVLENTYNIIIRQKKLLWFTTGYTQIAILIPLLLALPNYFGRVFMLGGLIQTAVAFGAVQDALSFIVNSYSQMAEWRATSLRLTTFINHMNSVEASVNGHLLIHQQPNTPIVVKNLSIMTPQNKILIAHFNQTFVAGGHYLIKGAAGLGKSTFIRTMAGIWPFASGEIMLPQDQLIMYVPQKTYMPIGTLYEGLLFPHHLHHPEQLDQIADILSLCQLAPLIPRINETATWSQMLSMGEQQRIIFARILIMKPDWVFLDESTASLDLNSEKHLYSLLMKELPNLAIISIGHRKSLEKYHQHIIHFNSLNPN